MSDDQTTRNEDDKPTDGQTQRRRSSDADDDKGQQSIQTEQKAPPANADTEGGDEGDTEPATFEDGLDDATGLEATANYNRAVSDYDPALQEIQISEHWQFQDAEFNTRGQF